MNSLLVTLAFPSTMMPNLALVRATFKRLGSLRNPTPWCSLDLTHDNTMKSFSRPWKASTLATSISCITISHTMSTPQHFLYNNISTSNNNNNNNCWNGQGTRKAGDRHWSPDSRETTYLIQQLSVTLTKGKLTWCHFRTCWQLTSLLQIS